MSSTSSAKTMMDGNTTEAASSTTNPITGNTATNPASPSKVSMTQNTANTVAHSSTTIPITGNTATNPSSSNEVSMTQNMANTKNASKAIETTKNERNEKSTMFNKNSEAATICFKYLPIPPPTKPVTKGTTGRFL